MYAHLITLLIIHLKRMGANQTIKRLINLLYCVKLDSDQKFNTSTKINESNEKYAVAY